MSSIDERIVAMRFNNSQFEKGVKESMRTLAELREATNLDDVAVSMKDVSKSINQNLQFESPAKSAGIFSKALTGLGKVAKTTFNAATFPLQALGRSLQSLGKYTRAVLGIDIASQLVNTGEQVIRAFTIDPLKSGWNEYELKMDSIKTIMTGTIKSYTDAMTKSNPSFLYDEEKHLDYVKQGLEELNTYADKTIYSFQDMTTSVGQFTNAGIEFDTAISAVKGISNLAAYAGQGAAQATSAMYNFAQSLGIGHLERIDWKSIEVAKMATPQFKQTLIDIGLALGKLKQEGENVYAVTEKGIIDKDTIVSVETFRETLTKTKWVSNDVLLGALGVFSGEYSKSELMEMFNITDELAEQFLKIGQEATKSATQVRTFTKMWDALKEAAQSGWAISWELIFGDLNEATDFWTGLNKRFSELLEKQAESRNALLHAWRGQRQQYNYETGEIEWISDERLVDGRKILVDALHEMLDVISEIGGGISEAWTSIFGAITGENLLDVTKKFKGFTKAFSDWVGKRNDPTSRISKLSTGLKGIFSVLKGAGSVVGGAITTISQALRLDKLLDAGISIFGQAGEWLGGLGASISGVWESIGQTEIMQKLSGFFGELWDSVSNFFTKTNEETGNTGFVDWLDSTFQKLNSIWNWFTETDFYKKAGEIWNTIVGYFSPKTVMGKMGNQWTEDSDFVRHIKTAFNSIKDFFTEVQGWPIWGKISGFFTPIIQTVTDFFSPQSTKSMIKLPQNAVRLASAAASDFAFDSAIPKTQDSPFVTWIKNAFNELKTFFESSGVSEILDTVGNKFSSIVESVISFFSPKTIVGKMGNTWTGDSEFVTRVKDAFEQIKAFFTEVQGWAIWGEIESFFEPLFAKITNIFSAETFDENGEKTGGTAFGNFITAASETFSSKWEEFKTWASGIYESIKGWFEGETWNGIRGFFTELGSSLSSVLGDEKRTDANDIDKKQGFFTSIIESVGSLIEKVKNTDIVSLLSEFFRSIGDMLGSAAEAVKVSKLGNTASKLITTVTNSLINILGVVENLISFAKDVGDFFYPDSKGAIGVLDSTTALIKTIIASILGILGSIVTGATSMAISSAASAFKQISKIFLMLSVFLGTLSVFMGLMAIMPTDVRNTVLTITAIIGIIGIIGVLIYSFVHTQKKMLPTIKEVTKELVSNWWTDLLGSIVKWAGIIALFAWGLPPVIEALKGFNVDAGQLAVLFGGIILLIGAITGISALISKVKINALSMAQAGLGIGAAIVAAITPIFLALWALGGIDIWLPDITEAVIRGAELIGEMIRAFNIAAYGEEVSNDELVADLQRLSEPIMGLSVVGSNVNTQGLLQLEESMRIIKRIFDIKINDASWLSQFFAGEVTISDAFDHMKGLAGTMTAFNNELTGVDFSNTISALRAFESFANILASLAYIRREFGSISEWIENMMAITDLDEDQWQNLEDFVSSCGSAINGGISAAAEDVTANPIMDAIIKSIRNRTGDVQEAIKGAVLNTGSTNTVADSVETAAEQTGEEVKDAWTLLSERLMESMTEGGNNLLNGGLMEGLNQVIGLFSTPGGVAGAGAGALGIGSFINYLLGDNAGLLPFNLGELLGSVFGVDVSHLLPEGWTLEGVVGILTSGDEEKIGELLSTAFGINLDGLNLNEIQNTTIGDLTKLLSTMEGYEGSAIQRFFAQNDPNATIASLIQKYIPEGADLDGVDLTNIAEVLKALGVSELAGIGEEWNAMGLGNLGAVFNTDEWATWLGISPEAIDFTNLQATVQTIVPVFVEAIIGGISEGLKNVNLGDNSLLDPLWQYLGIDSATIEFTDLQTNVTTVVASIVPTIANGVYDGVTQGLSGLNLLDPVWQWFGVDASKIDTSSLRASIASIAPELVSEVKAGVADGLKNEPLLNMMLSRMLTGGNKSQYSVTPVLDDSGLDGNSLLALQNGSIKLTGSVQIDAVNLGSVISAINSNGSRIVSAVNNMGSRIDNLGAAISRIQIVLDTGAVAGAVDAKLGQSTTLQSRTGTTSGITRIYNNQNVSLANIGG